MDSDEIYKIIGYIVAVIFFIYLISKAFSLNVRVIEGMTSNDKQSNIKKNKNNEGGKETDEEKKTISEKEKQNDDIKSDILKDKDNYKDSLNAAYTNQLYALIKLSTEVGFKQDFTKMDFPDQSTVDKYNKLKSMKDYLDILDFAYNEVVNLS